MSVFFVIYQCLSVFITKLPGGGLDMLIHLTSLDWLLIHHWLINLALFISSSSCCCCFRSTTPQAAPHTTKSNEEPLMGFGFALSRWVKHSLRGYCWLISIYSSNWSDGSQEGFIWIKGNPWSGCTNPDWPLVQKKKLHLKLLLIWTLVCSNISIFWQLCTRIGPHTHTHTHRIRSKKLSENDIFHGNLCH